MLKNQRHELFAQGIARGLTQEKAYAEAGYADNPSAASRLLSNVKIKQRIEELNSRKIVKHVLTRQLVVEALIDNWQKASGQKPVRIGKGADAQEVFVYEGNVVNASIRLMGLEQGMFVDRRDVRLVTEYDKLTDVELARQLKESAQLLLEYQPDGGDDDGADS